MKKYSLLLQWSEEDDCYLATCPEFKDLINMGGPFCHGDNWGEVADEAIEAMTGLLGVFEEGKVKLPEPQYYKWKETNGAGS